MTHPDDLIAGFHRFRKQHFADGDTLYRQLVEVGQTPKILVVACCDSRVDPAIVLDCAPGDLFVIRNVANLVPPAESAELGHHGTSAALEYGVRMLGVHHIIVLGHAHCGGIAALLDGAASTADSYIENWMRLAEPARRVAQAEKLTGSLHRTCEQQAILGSLANLMTFDWIRQRVEQGTLALHGWYFDIERGELLRYNPVTAAFELT
ncbi:MAG: carbonic anhydrase [Sideroxydans sp.]